MDVSKLKAGDNHYMAYVGPPTQYDFMGATQFRLLCTLGLRANHYLLDVGCGSLRAGRLFIPYLDECKYYGVEPNKWLIQDAIENQIGQDLIRIKKPAFDYNENFSVDVFNVHFNFILAQSIFSHTGNDLVITALRNFRKVLKDDGSIVATFVQGNKDFDGNGWIYPGCVSYRADAIKRFAKDADLLVTCIPWYHPRQTWYIFAKKENRLPRHSMIPYLRGTVLFDPEFEASYKISQKIKRDIFNQVRPFYHLLMDFWKKGYSK